jgi:hypothetical protein
LIQNAGEIFKLNELMSIFKDANLPYSVSYFTIFIKYGIVVRIGRGIYSLPSEPIYVGVIKTALTEIRSYKLNANKKALSIQNEREVNEKIEQAINFLKSNGFLVLKPM